MAGDTAQGIGVTVQNKALLRVNLKLAAAEAGGFGLAIVQPRSYGVEIRVIKTVPQAGVLQREHGSGGAVLDGGARLLAVKREVDALRADNERLNSHLTAALGKVSHSRRDLDGHSAVFGKGKVCSGHNMQRYIAVNIRLQEKMLDYGSRHTTPVTLGTAIGMTWAAAFEKDGSVLKRAWVIGPVFYQDVSLRGIEQGLQYYNRLETSVAWTMQLYEALKTVPVLQCTVLHRYALMMHYCLTGNHLAISDINSEFLAQVRNTVQQPAHDRHKVWMAEQGLLQMVRTGDLNYRQALSASMGISAGVPVRSDDALRQSKTSIIVFTSLVCRAAIEGGLFAGGSLRAGGQLHPIR